MKEKLKEKIVESIKLLFKKNKKIALIVSGGIIAVLLLLVFLLGTSGKSHDDEEVVVNVTTLEKMIYVNELSTFEAIYNGIAVVNNEKKPEKVDCYVSYEAVVKAGIEFNKIDISMDEDEKLIKIRLPRVEINEIDLDMGSLDYMFVNDKANESAISAKALEACKLDVQTESSNEDAIYHLAKQNAESIILALTSPFINQLDSSYELLIEWEG